MTGQNALVTGSHGFVGRHFVRRLLGNGYEVTGVDALVPGSGARPLLEWVDSLPSGSHDFNEELTDARVWFSQNSDTYFDLVIHLAAVVGGRETIERNPLAVAEDLEIDSAFWRWVVKSSPGHVISFSSSAAYPISMQTASSGDTLLDENDLTFEGELGMPDLTYGWAKMTSEYLGRVVAREYGVKVASYRPFSGYGSDQDANYPFRAICERALRREVDGQGRFFVWGSGDQKRDFVHIDDVVDCVMATYLRITDGTALNISTGRLTSFKELAKLACNATNWDPEIVGIESRPQGVFSRGGSIIRQNALGFSPKISIEEGVARCIQELG